MEQYLNSFELYAISQQLGSIEEKIIGDKIKSKIEYLLTYKFELLKECFNEELKFATDVDVISFSNIVIFNNIRAVEKGDGYYTETVFKVIVEITSDYKTIDEIVDVTIQEIIEKLKTKYVFVSKLPYDKED